ncbi:MAG: hypothetical protein AMDU5_GPLC00004G0121 [Thermoplasmatales archaeon Gpl]|nr:MAG: hypothetical protein AMDU5_GPLC00004G0121 [Thermoplasmatales archaeon Gpl]
MLRDGRRKREIRYLADNMLGRLARYMRIMGYDTSYPNLEISDNELIEISRADDRVLLSRDKQLCSRFKQSIYIISDRIDEQIIQITNLERPRKEFLFSRCTVCNGVLVKGDHNCKEEYDPRKIETVYHCPNCGKCYWEGTHSHNILAKLESLKVYNETQAE